ncbi:ribosomal protection-like ABC-F family protein [Jiulongibacter sediminis]|uniref:Probable ATP-binding protein YbiT n=1 Tax=Jiulongibacter sediminis TaxID=1605367 RepID=A0A0P7BYH7_9BACT|nr:ABC-F family ATP-binding cassette domain-containing protein [Jiulongibacter sediminis]KPM49928.1 ABC transporter ATP-binding protein [Jiulongibacter sediminis]TBX26964.1 ABC transporter ATP-binding protein [Jiulongibacter sediminis]
MLTIHNLSFYFGGRPIFEEASLQVKPKDKIGLIGLNGKGKSTLLKLIVGEYTPDGGTISMAGDVTLGFLNQDLLSYESAESILLVAMQGFQRELELQHQIEEVLHKMETNYTDELVHELGELQEEYDILGGYSIQARAEEILEGLGFRTEDLQRPLKEFSGGWRMRVMLAKLLLQKPSVLLLDEPTNHLDLPSIQWIEKYIANYENAVIVVSHDRTFLDNVTTSTVEVSNCKLNFYPGNYSFYLEEKELRNEIQKGAYENQQAQIRQTERFIERFKAKATKARQVQSRVKALERMDMVEDVISDDAKVHFRFQFGTQPGRHVMRLDNISKAYDENVILKNTVGHIERGDKIALIGANGKGKSTLLRIIAGTEKHEGQRALGHNVNFSFYAQHQLESLHVNETLLDELKYADSTKSETELRSVLGCFLFGGEDVFKKIKVLSGGEKSRVALAKVLISEANFLLLDEPTNHLDMQSVNILVQALQQYEGTYVVVSHDRHFVSQVANKIWYIEDQEIKVYPGTFEEYLWWQAEREKDGQGSQTIPKKVETTDENPVEKKSFRDKSNDERKRLEKEIEELEEKIEDFELQKLKIEAKLAEKEVFSDPEKLAKENKRYEKVKFNLNQAHEKWEAKMLELED